MRNSSWRNFSGSGRKYFQWPRVFFLQEVFPVRNFFARNFSCRKFFCRKFLARTFSCRKLFFKEIFPAGNFSDQIHFLTGKICKISCDFFCRQNFKKIFGSLEKIYLARKNFLAPGRIACWHLTLLSPCHHLSRTLLWH